MIEKISEITIFVYNMIKFYELDKFPAVVI